MRSASNTETFRAAHEKGDPRMVPSQGEKFLLGIGGVGDHDVGLGGDGFLHRVELLLGGVEGVLPLIGDPPRIPSLEQGGVDHRVPRLGDGRHVGGEHCRHLHRGRVFRLADGQRAA
jgi:hypothetical protein